MTNETTATSYIEQAIADPRLNFRIQRSAVRYVTERGAASDSTMDDKHVLFRADNKLPLAVVGAGFKVHQPAQMFRFYDAVAARHDARLTNITVTHGGKGFHAVAKLGGSFRVAGRDMLDLQLRFRTRNDGTARTEISVELLRLMCLNQLPAFKYENGNALYELSKKMNDVRQAVAISHRTAFNPEAVVLDIDTALADAGAMVERLRMLSGAPMPLPKARQIVADLLDPATATKTEREIENTKGFKTVMDLFTTTGRGALENGVRGTAWGLLNAISEFTDHHARAKTEDHRLDSAIGGVGADLKARAYGALLAAI